MFHVSYLFSTHSKNLNRSNSIYGHSREMEKIKQYVDLESKIAQNAEMEQKDSAKASIKTCCS